MNAFRSVLGSPPWVRGFVAVAQGCLPCSELHECQVSVPRGPQGRALYIGTDLLVPGLLKRQSLELHTPLFKKGKRKEKERGQREKLIFFNLWLFPFLPSIL